MRAAIDLGSNSVLLTVLDGERLVHDEVRVVGLGRGVGESGAFLPDPMEATLAALKDFSRRCTGLGLEPGEVVALTTSAARRATNAADFFARVRATTGFGFRTLSGDEEAQRTFIGAMHGLKADGRVLVVDLGGGSTELAMGIDRPDFAHSYPLGSVRLTESVLGREVREARPADLIEMRKRVELALDAVELPGQPDVVVGVAGSVTTLCATEMNLSSFDAEVLHGASLSDEVLGGFEALLLGLDAAQRRAVFPTAPGRADYLLAGCVILRAVLARGGEPQLMVSTRGLRFGALLPLPVGDERQGLFTR